MSTNSLVASNRSATTTVPVEPLKPPLLSIDIRAHFSLLDAIKTICAGMFLLIYGTVLAIAWTCSILLHHPAITVWIILIASASSVCIVDAWQENETATA
jgi:hypothetical protein